MPPETAEYLGRGPLGAKRRSGAGGRGCGRNDGQRCRSAWVEDVLRPAAWWQAHRDNTVHGGRGRGVCSEPPVDVTTHACTTWTLRHATQLGSYDCRCHRRWWRRALGPAGDDVRVEWRLLTSAIEREGRDTTRQRGSVHVGHRSRDGGAGTGEASPLYPRARWSAPTIAPSLIAIKTTRASYGGWLVAVGVVVAVAVAVTDGRWRGNGGCKQGRRRLFDGRLPSVFFVFS